MNLIPSWLRKVFVKSDATTSAPPSSGGGSNHVIQPRVPAMPSGTSIGEGQRMYAMAVPNRFNQGFPSFNTSADLELVSSLRNLRARSRALVRDAGYAKSAQRVIVNNVIGSGVRMRSMVQTARGDSHKGVNDAIDEAWCDWMEAENCHTGGELHFHDLERQCMGQIFEAGEIFLRMYPQKFGNSDVPLALEIIEPERIVDGYAYPGAVAEKSGGVRMGIEHDKFKKPIAYWVRDLHPGDIRLNLEENDKVTRIDAADIIHLRIIDRWPQTRGVPWLHAAAGKLQDLSGYSEAEVIAARGAASYMATIETAEAATTLGQQAPDNTFQTALEPGMIMKLNVGEKFNPWSPNRPNGAFDPFMKYMLREIAAAVGVSYESLSHDYSQGSYSSMRVSLLDERDCWKVLQYWWIRAFRKRLHNIWLQRAVLSRAIPTIDLLQYGTNMKKFHSVHFRPRGWSWVDPQKEVAAYVQAVKSGYRTVESVIEETGNGVDFEVAMQHRADELDAMRAKKLVFDTSPEVFVPAETRGQMLINEDGDIIPAAEATAQIQQKYGQTPTPTPVKPATQEEPPSKVAAAATAKQEAEEKADRGLRLVRGE